MRISPVPYIYQPGFSIIKLIDRAAAGSAGVTHNHPEGIKGAQATAWATYLSRTEKDKSVIKKSIEDNYGYDLDFDLEDLRKNYKFNESCQKTVPQAIYCFLISNSYEDTIRKCISIGGDSDTLAAIAGSISEAYYGVPIEMVEAFVGKIPTIFGDILYDFYNKYVFSREGKDYGNFARDKNGVTDNDKFKILEKKI